MPAPHGRAGRQAAPGRHHRVSAGQTVVVGLLGLAGGWGRSRGLERLAGKWRCRRGGGRTEWRRQNKRRQPKGRRRWLAACRRCRWCRRFRRCRRRSRCWRRRFRDGDGGWWLLQPAARHPGVVRIRHKARRHHLGRRHLGRRWRGSRRVLVVVVHPPQRRERKDQHHSGRPDTPAEQVTWPFVVGYPATAADLL
jgi:hypothetical protein